MVVVVAVAVLVVVVVVVVVHFRVFAAHPPYLGSCPLSPAFAA